MIGIAGQEYHNMIVSTITTRRADLPTALPPIHSSGLNTGGVCHVGEKWALRKRVSDVWESTVGVLVSTSVITRDAENEDVMANDTAPRTLFDSRVSPYIFESPPFTSRTEYPGQLLYTIQSFPLH